MSTRGFARALVPRLVPKPWVPLVGVLVLGACSEGTVSELDARYGSSIDDTTVAPGDGRDVSVFDLAVGACFDDPSEIGEIGTVPITDCGSPHDNEVYELFDLAKGLYPGDDVVDEAGADGCLASFDDYVGLDYFVSSLDYSFLTPTGGTWAEGDREIVCFLYRVDLDKMTGSMQGAEI